MSNQIEILNLELTTKCPLKCPQCYCTLNTGKDMDRNTAFRWIEEASKCNVKVLNLSGGETLCYPHIYDVIEKANNLGIATNVALSGLGFNREVYQRLISAGVSGIFISLNGSTNEINRKSRNGYRFGINALEVLRDQKYQNTTINWVMQSSNADDFEQMISLAEKYSVANLTILSLKPDSNQELKNVPSRSQMEQVATSIRKYKGSVTICVETCYSPMLALLGQSFLFGNRNTGEDKGCMAGRTCASVSVDGFLTPCRHLYCFEKWDSLEEYWNNSLTLQKIRSLEYCKREPCSSCKYCDYCRHCLAINSMIYNELFIGNTFCPLAEKAGS